MRTEYLSALSKSSTSLTTSRPPPPLPPTPPPYSASSTPPSKTSTSQSHLYNQSSIGPSDFVQTPVAPFKDPRTVTLSVSYPPPSLMPPLVFSRPNSMLYGTSPTPHQGENQPSISQNLPIPLPTFQPFQSLGQLQPLQPPQILRPPQPPQHLRPPVPPSPQSEQGVSLLQSPVQMQVHQQLQILQQPHVSPLHVYYQSPQHESFSHPQQQQQHQQQQVEHSQLQIMHQQGGTSQQQQDPMMSLQHFFSSPEAIQVFETLQPEFIGGFHHVFIVLC